MNEQWQRSGVKLSVFLTNQEAIVGWIVHEDVNKLVLALDPERDNLRTIFRRQIVRLEVDPNPQTSTEPIMGSERLALLRQFGPRLVAELEPALSGVDHRRLTHNASKMREIAKQRALVKGGHVQDTLLPDRSEKQLIPPRELYDSLQMSRDLLEEIGRTRILGIVTEHTERLRHLVHEETIPLFDAEWAGPDATHRLVHLARENQEGLADSAEMLSEASAKVWDRKDSARWVDGVGDVVLGGMLATVNVAAGATAGIISTLPTLGIGTVAAAIGAATSTFTGLSTLKKGLFTLIKGAG